MQQPAANHITTPAPPTPSPTRHCPRLAARRVRARLFAQPLHAIEAVSVASQKHAAMKLNIANPSTGQMKVTSKTPTPNPHCAFCILFFIGALVPVGCSCSCRHAQVIECDDDRKLRNFYDKRINAVGLRARLRGFGILSCACGIGVLALNLFADC